MARRSTDYSYLREVGDWSWSWRVELKLFWFGFSRVEHVVCVGGVEGCVKVRVKKTPTPTLNSNSSLNGNAIGGAACVEVWMVHRLDTWARKDVVSSRDYAHRIAEGRLRALRKRELLGEDEHPVVASVRPHHPSILNQCMGARPFVRSARIRWLRIRSLRDKPTMHWF